MNYCTTRADLFKLLPPGSNVAEIGVFRGEFSEEIIEACNPLNLYLVDIWTGRFGSGNKDGHHYTVMPDMLEVYLGLCLKYRDRPEVRLIRSDSAAFFRCWDEHYFDAVYIDADHSYASVYADLQGAANAVKPGGFLMGHDYHGEPRRAVDAFCLHTGLTISAIARDGCPSFMIQV